jgi:dienelactone hydrolase
MIKTAGLLFLLLFGVPLTPQAQDVSISLNQHKLTANANYTKGDTSKPAVLILHGFLTNNKFHTITAMEDILQMEGYTTLSPILTLGINNRRDPLTCSSIHTHTLQQDMSEIDQWVNWLTQQGHRQVILLGHSSGSQQLLEYLVNYPASPVVSSIFTSSFYLYGKELGSKESEIQQAKNDLETGYTQPRKYNFLFCNNNYNATAESFLSYQTITRQRILSTLKQLKIPHYTIMGGDDERYGKVGRSWLDEQQAAGTELHVVEQANHFFSSDSEPKLQEALIKILTKRPSL